MYLTELKINLNNMQEFIQIRKNIYIYRHIFFFSFIFEEYVTIQVWMSNPFKESVVHVLWPIKKGSNFFKYFHVKYFIHEKSFILW